MRIALVNWSPIWDGAQGGGGGIGGYVQALAFELMRAGHEVHHISSGRSYTSLDAQPSVRVSNWLRVRCHEIVDSPVPAPSLDAFAVPEREAASPQLERCFLAVLGQIRPDVLHVHSLEGLSAGCLSRAGSVCPTLFSIHNHHTLCPQVYLLQRHVEPCLDAQGGATCASCVAAKSFEEVVGSRVSPAQETPGLIQRVRGRFASADAPKPGSGPERDLQTTPSTLRLLSEVEAEPEPTTRHALPVLAEHEPEPDLATPHGRRRSAMVAALNACDAVHAVSPFVADLYAKRGVSPQSMRVEPIGTRMTRIAGKLRELCFAPPRFADDPSRPIRIVFFGSAHFAKGLHVFGEALALLSPDQLARLEVTVQAADIERVAWQFQRLQPRLGKLTLGGGYNEHDIPWLLGGKDVGVVPSLWWDNGPQTVLELQACGVPVIGARAGGISSMVRDGVDGRLFDASQPESLAGVLREILAEPRLLDRYRDGVEPPASIESHAETMAAWYRELIERRPGGGSAAGDA